MLDFLVEQVFLLWDSLAYHVTKLAGKIADTASDVLDAAIFFASELFDAAYDAIVNVYSWAAGIVSDALAAAIKFAQSLFDGLVDTITKIYSWVAGIVSDALAAAIKFAQSLFDGVVDTITKIYSWVAGIVSDALAAAIEFAQNLYDAALSIIVDSYDALKAEIVELLGADWFGIKPYLPVLVLFLTAPGTFIFTYLAKFFWIWLEYQTANAIAPDDIDLGPAPRFEDMFPER